MNRVLITVEGGVVQDISTDVPGIVVFVRDFDNDAQGDYAGPVQSPSTLLRPEELDFLLLAPEPDA